MEMKKGYSLIELVVVMALTAILLSTASLSIKKIKEKRALEKAKFEVAEIMRSYVNRSFNDGVEYTVAIDHAGGNIKVTDSGSVVKVGMELPQSLKYSVSGDGVTVDDWTGMTTVVGSGDESLQVYINDGDGNSRYRVEMLKSDLTKLIDVKVEKWSSSGWEEE